MTHETENHDQWWVDGGGVTLSPPGPAVYENVTLTVADLVSMLQELGHTYRPPRPDLDEAAEAQRRRA